MCMGREETVRHAYPGGTPLPPPAPASTHSPISPLSASFRLTLSEGATLEGGGGEAAGRRGSKGNRECRRRSRSRGSTERTRGAAGEGERARGALLRARPFNCVPRRVAAERQGMREGRGERRLLLDSVCFHYADFHFHFDWIRFGFVLVSIEFNSIAGNEASSYPPSPFSLPLSRTQ